MKITINGLWEAETKSLHMAVSIAGAVPDMPDTVVVGTFDHQAGDILFGDQSNNELRKSIGNAMTNGRIALQRYIQAAEVLPEARELLGAVPNCPVVPTPDKWLLLDAEGVVFAVKDTEKEADDYILGSLVKLTKQKFWQPPPVQMGWVVVNHVGTAMFWFDTEADARLYIEHASGEDEDWRWGYIAVPEGLPKGEVPVLQAPMGWIVYMESGLPWYWFDSEADAKAWLDVNSELHDETVEYGEVPQGLPKGVVPVLPGPHRAWVVYNQSGTAWFWFDEEADAVLFIERTKLEDEVYEWKFTDVPEGLQKGVVPELPVQMAWILYKPNDDLSASVPVAWYDDEDAAFAAMNAVGYHGTVAYEEVPEGLPKGGA